MSKPYSLRFSKNAFSVFVYSRTSATALKSLSIGKSLAEFISAS